MSLEVLLRGTCQPRRLLDVVENFTLFSDSKGGLIKFIAQNHQVIGVNKAIAATLEARRRGHGRGVGVLADPGQRQELLDGLLQPEDPFTGTPLIDGKERTRDVFGEYVSIR